MSSIMVTGPSFTDETSMSAPNLPVSTLKPLFLHSSITSSYKGMAVSGLAASEKPGLLTPVSVGLKQPIPAE